MRYKHGGTKRGVPLTLNQVHIALCLQSCQLNPLLLAFSLRTDEELGWRKVFMK